MQTNWPRKPNSLGPAHLGFVREINKTNPPLSFHNSLAPQHFRSFPSEEVVDRGKLLPRSDLTRQYL